MASFNQNHITPNNVPYICGVNFAIDYSRGDVRIFSYFAAYGHVGILQWYHNVQHVYGASHQ